MTLLAEQTFVFPTVNQDPGRHHMFWKKDDYSGKIEKKNFRELACMITPKVLDPVAHKTFHHMHEPPAKPTIQLMKATWERHLAKECGCFKPEIKVLVDLLALCDPKLTLHLECMLIPMDPWAIQLYLNHASAVQSMPEYQYAYLLHRHQQGECNGKLCQKPALRLVPDLVTA